jgi:hypothetical protein
MDDIRKLLFGDEEAQKKYDEGHNQNVCPLPPKPEPGLLAHIKDLEREVQNLTDDLWGNAGRYPYPSATVRANKPPHRHHAGRAAWIDWHMRKEDLDNRRPLPLLHRIELQRYRLVVRLREMIGL